MNDEAVCRTAPATPGLSIKFYKVVPTSRLIFSKLREDFFEENLPMFFKGFYGKTYLPDLGISCFKTPLEPLNDLGRTPIVAVITSFLTKCYPTSRRNLYKYIYF